MVKRNEIHLVDLGSTKGSEVKYIRPCLVVSPDEMNGALNTVIIAPMTTTIKKWPTRVQSTFQGKKGEIALDQIRAIDKTRLRGKLGALPAGTAAKVASTLVAMFSTIV